jgi:broad specificity phosphatase PhoE
MRQVILEVFATTESGDAVIVTHQLPIWMTHRSVQGKPLPHDPRNRRCALSSVTTFERHGGRIVETAYADPAASVAAVDRGAT